MASYAGKVMRIGFVVGACLLLVSIGVDAADPGPLPGAAILLFFGLMTMCYGLDIILDSEGSLYMRLAPEFARPPTRSQARFVAYISLAVGAMFGLPGLILAIVRLAGP